MAGLTHTPGTALADGMLIALIILTVALVATSAFALITTSALDDMAFGLQQTTQELLDVKAELADLIRDSYDNDYDIDAFEAEDRGYYPNTDVSDADMAIDYAELTAPKVPLGEPVLDLKGHSKACTCISCYGAWARYDDAVMAYEVQQVTNSGRRYIVGLPVSSDDIPF